MTRAQNTGSRISGLDWTGLRVLRTRPGPDHPMQCRPPLGRLVCACLSVHISDSIQLAIDSPKCVSLVVNWLMGLDYVSPGPLQVSKGPDRTFNGVQIIEEHDWTLGGWRWTWCRGGQGQTSCSRAALTYYMTYHTILLFYPTGSALKCYFRIRN